MADRPEEEKQPGEPKLVVDEDWKTRVQAEKAAAKQQAAQSAPQLTPATEESPAVDERDEESAAGSAPPAPAASFPLLVTSLAAQAMACLGLTVNPASGKPEVQLDWAKHFVDMLGILDETTKGNLAPHDEALLGNTLHDLRMAYVAIKNQQQSKSPQAGTEIHGVK